MSVIVALSVSEGVGMESNRVDFIIRRHDRNDASQGIVGSVGFNQHGMVGRPVSQDWGLSK